MILTCDRTALLSALRTLDTVISAKATMPIYKHVKATATADALTLQATDLEVGMRLTMIGTAIEEPGEAMLPASKINQILRESTDETIRMETSASKLKLLTFSAEYEMSTDNPQDFSDVADFDAGDIHYEFAAGDLSHMIQRTVFAAATDEGKYAMRAILLALTGNKIDMVASDGKRIAVASGVCTKFGDGTPATGSQLIPPKAMSLLNRIMEEGDAAQPIQVRLNANNALFRTERATIYTRLVEGRFPPYRDVIPKTSKAKAAIPVGEFLTAIRQAAVMTDMESKRILFAFEPDRLSLKAEGANTGRSAVTMRLTDYVGPKITMALDPIYLTDFLRAMPAGECVSMELIDDNKPAVFRSGSDYLYLVVPLI